MRIPRDIQNPIRGFDSFDLIGALCPSPIMAQFQSALRSLDTFSTGSGATPIFDSNQEPRFVELREIRQQITQSINNFVVERRSASVIPTDEREADQLDLDVYEELQDIDMKRSLVVLNVKNWIRHAHTLLDALHERRLKKAVQL